MGGDRTTNVQILTGSTTTETSESHALRGANMMFTADGSTSAGAGAASIVIEGHCGGEVWATIDTLSLTLGTAATVDFGSTMLPWTYVRARVASISGTGASVNVFLGVEV